jgi:hypothetical protein
LVAGGGDGGLGHGRGHGGLGTDFGDDDASTPALPLMSEEFVVLERISKMMSLPLSLPLPLMSEEFVVLEQILEMMIVGAESSPDTN